MLLSFSIMNLSVFVQSPFSDKNLPTFFTFKFLILFMNLDYVIFEVTMLVKNSFTKLTVYDFFVNLQTSRLIKFNILLGYVVCVFFVFNYIFLII